MDWDLTDMPPAWHSQHMRSATARALSRLPWTDTPSMDGESYLTNGSRITISLLTNSSLPHAYKLIRANDHPETRDHVLSLAEYFFQSGERGGPMATYLVSASKRRNFHLQLNTTVARVLRTGDHANGVQVGPTYPGGLNGTIKLTPKMGRVILSAGVFNTAKILFRSAIGPREQLHIVQNSTDGPLMLDEKHWIERPVGRNLDDAPSVYLAVSGFALDTYDWESLWDKPPAADVQRYLHNRSGPLAEIQPSLGPVFWDEIRGEDSRTRVVQWTTNSGVLNGQGTFSSFPPFLLLTQPPSTYAICPCKHTNPQLTHYAPPRHPRLRRQPQPWPHLPRCPNPDPPRSPSTSPHRPTSTTPAPTTSPPSSPPPPPSSPSCAAYPTRRFSIRRQGRGWKTISGRRLRRSRC